ncbi:aminotransferase class I/II-fold pyridoxal phosphate-dependent enzyme [Paraclostridium sp. AKS46]|nr:aminotransferase class I/II-fold pyridoxal phosphate-dependent enzyme [Paraclostridium sp. AKS46]
MPNSNIRVVASPGGSGSIKLAVFNYTEKQETILVPDWYWGPYKIICEEINRNITNYELFNKEGNFNFESFKDQFINLSQNKIEFFLYLIHQLIIQLDIQFLMKSGTKY